MTSFAMAIWEITIDPDGNTTRYYDETMGTLGTKWGKEARGPAIASNSLRNRAPDAIRTRVHQFTNPSKYGPGQGSKNLMTAVEAGTVFLGSAAAKTKGLLKAPKSGTIYRVPGEATSNKKPYIGRHNKPTPQKTRKSNDGRDRSQAEVVDNYDPKNVNEGRIKEQRQINKEGGVNNLDNKRNEIAPNKWPDDL